MNAVQVTEGVMGLEGFVPLEEPHVYCSRECVQKHCAGEDAYRYGYEPRLP